MCCLLSHPIHVILRCWRSSGVDCGVGKHISAGGDSYGANHCDPRGKTESKIVRLINWAGIITTVYIRYTVSKINSFGYVPVFNLLWHYSCRAAASWSQPTETDSSAYDVIASNKIYAYDVVTKEKDDVYSEIHTISKREDFCLRKCTAYGPVSTQPNIKGQDEGVLGMSTSHVWTN